MATRPEVIERFLEVLRPAGPVNAKKMFGEAAIYYDGRVVALICADRLFMKVTPIAGKYLGNEHLSAPYPGAKPSLLVPQEREGDSEWLCAWIQESAPYIDPPKKKRR